MDNRCFGERLVAGNHSRLLVFIMMPLSFVFSCVLTCLISQILLILPSPPFNQWCYFPHLIVNSLYRGSILLSAKILHWVISIFMCIFHLPVFCELNLPKMSMPVWRALASYRNGAWTVYPRSPPLTAIAGIMVTAPGRAATLARICRQAFYHCVWETKSNQTEATKSSFWLSVFMRFVSFHICHIFSGALDRCIKHDFSLIIASTDL